MRTTPSGNLDPRNQQRGTWEFLRVDELPRQPGMPDLFVGSDGSRLTSTQEWPAQRVYLKAMLAHYLYGSMPSRPKQFELQCIRKCSICDGKAVHERYAIMLGRNGKSAEFHFEVIRPDKMERVPGIIKNCYTFFEREIAGKAGLTAAYDWAAAEEAVLRGYLLCKFDRTEVAPNERSNRNRGVFPLYQEYDWGSIAAWAWAHGVVVDALDRLELIDMEKIVATGHSRGGKTALCAGIYDERIAITAPNSSGTGGTGSLRYFEPGRPSQCISYHKTMFPHWWVDRFFEFEDKEDRLPFDAHTAKALIAPRALINLHARQDYWANPYGTELTYRAAEKAFDWLQSKGQQGIHWREGGHAQAAEDWIALLDFADWIFFSKRPLRSFSTLAYPDSELPITWDVPGCGGVRNAGAAYGVGI